MFGGSLINQKQQNSGGNTNSEISHIEWCSIEEMDRLVQAIHYAIANSRSYGKACETRAAEVGSSQNQTGINWLTLHQVIPITKQLRIWDNITKRAISLPLHLVEELSPPEPTEDVSEHTKAGHRASSSSVDQSISWSGEAIGIRDVKKMWQTKTCAHSCYWF